MKKKHTPDAVRQSLLQEKPRCRKLGCRSADSPEMVPQKPVLEPCPVEGPDSSKMLRAEKPIQPVPLPPPQEPIY